MKKNVRLAVALFAIAAVSLLSVGLGVGYAMTAEDPEKTDVPAAARYSQNVSASVGLYQEAMRPYRTETVGRGGETIAAYSGDFAGVYVDDDGLLNIGIVGLQRASTGYNGQVIYRSQRFSYNALQEIVDTVTPVMRDYGIFYGGRKAAG